MTELRGVVLLYARPRHDSGAHATSLLSQSGSDFRQPAETIFSRLREKCCRCAQPGRYNKTAHSLEPARRLNFEAPAIF